MNDSLPVRAIDVGFGNTKFVLGTSNGEVQCTMFPSLTPLAAPNDHNGAILQRRNTVVIEVNGVRYEIGKDSVIAQGANPTRVLDPTFATSDAYIALVRGALYFMGASHIENLIVGLPVSTVRDLQEGLIKTLTGSHPVPSAGSNPEPRTVTIGRVFALAQPLGAFFDYAHRASSFNDMKSQMNLIVDPGFFTLDWLLCHGVKGLWQRSGAYNGGVSSILRAVLDEIGRGLKTQLTDITELDNAIREGRNPRYFGQEVDISQYKQLILSKTREAVSSLSSTVGSGSDIDNIILAGGGAELYQQAIQEKFPHHRILLTRDPVYANVRGFQRAGESWLRGSVPGRMVA